MDGAAFRVPEYGTERAFPRRAEDGGGSEPGRSIERCSPGNLHKKTPLLLECKKQSFDFMINSAFKTNKPHFFE